MQLSSTSALGHIVTLLLTISVAIPSQAQISSQSRSQQYREYVQPYDLNLLREATSQKQRLYDQNVRAIQDKINALYQRFEETESIKSDFMELVRNEVNRYVNQLRTTRIDYSDSQNYTVIVNALKSYNADLTSAIREAIETEKQDAAPLAPQSPINRIAETYTYASIFEKPDGAKAIHLVDKDETVTILGENGGYFYVQCGSHNGYLQKGMIKRILP